MAQHVHKFAPGAAITSKASADVTGGQLLAVSGDGTVAPAGAKSTAWLGAAATDEANGASVLVLRGGVQNLLASGAIVAGDLVTAGANGTVAKLATVTTPTAPDVTDTRAIVGTALTGGTGVIVSIAMAR